MQTKKNENSRIITDDELNNLLDEEQDKLGTRVYIIQLKQIIESLSEKELASGFNIGLYGSWGSGKSSIIRSLCDSISKDDFQIIEFDCWKYSDDDLRRSFLLTALDSLHSDHFDIKYLTDVNTGKPIEKIEKTVQNKKYMQLRKEIDLAMYSDRSVTSTKGYVDRERLKLIIIGILINSIAILFIRYYGLKDVVDLGNLFGGFGILSICIAYIHGKVDKDSGVGYALSDIIEKFGGNIPMVSIAHKVSNVKLFSVEQFEKWFKIILGHSDPTQVKPDNKNLILSRKASWYNTNSKFLFIFDNIDRCDKETVKEILKTLKTFLNQKNCIFLIPIDYDSVCKHYCVDDPTIGDEYLRKIFNLGVHIKKVHNIDLKKLIIDIINSQDWRNHLGITEEEVNSIGFILSQSFVDNPRKVKQFLNNLGSEYLLAQGKHSMLEVAKLLLIKQELPGLYELIKHDPSGATKTISRYDETTLLKQIENNNNSHKSSKEKNSLKRQLLSKSALLKSMDSIKPKWYSILYITENHSAQYLEIQEYYQNYQYDEICEFSNKSEENLIGLHTLLEDTIKSYSRNKNTSELTKISTLISLYFIRCLKGRISELYVDFLIVFCDRPEVFSADAEVGFKLIEKVYKDGERLLSTNQLTKLKKTFQTNLTKLVRNQTKANYDLILEVLKRTSNDLNILQTVSVAYSEYLLKKEKNYVEHFEALSDSMKEEVVDDTYFMKILNNSSQYESLDGNIKTFIAKHGRIGNFRSVVLSKFFNTTINDQTINIIKTLELDIVSNRIHTDEIKNINEKYLSWIKGINSWYDISQNRSSMHQNKVKAIERIKGKLPAIETMLYTMGDIKSYHDDLLTLIFNLISKGILSDELFDALAANIELRDNWNSDAYAGKIIELLKGKIAQQLNISNRIYKVISIMITNTTITKEKKYVGLNNNQIDKIIYSLYWKEDTFEKELISNLWKNKLSQKQILQNIADTQDIQEKHHKIMYLRELGYTFNKSNLKVLRKGLTEQILIQLDSNTLQGLESVCKRIKDIPEYKDLINISLVKKKLQIFPMEDFNHLPNVEYVKFENIKNETLKLLDL